MLSDFHIEFRPLVSSQSFSHVSPTEETLLDEGETASGLGCVFWFLVLVFVWCSVWFGVACVLFPSSCCVSFPFNDDLGTPPTWRPHSRKTLLIIIQMATLPDEHKPTALGIPAHLPIPYHLECARAMLQSLHALFALLATGDTLTYCPQAATSAKALSAAARTDNGHIASLASSGTGAAFRKVHTCGVFGAGKTRSLTFPLAWLALTTHLKIAAAHKENPAGRAITKLLTTFDLQPSHQQHFIRPVGLKKQRQTLPKQPLTCKLAKQPHAFRAAAWSLSPQALCGTHDGPLPLLSCSRSHWLCL